VRVVVADDAMLIREGLTRLLRDAGVTVVGKAADADELLRHVALGRPDVAVVDIRMPPTNTDDGLRAAVAIRAAHPGVGVLVLSQYIEADYALELIGGDARGVGYLLKDRISDIEEFADAIRRVACGGSVLDPEVVRWMLGRRHETSALSELTPREHEVLGLLAQGFSNAGVASKIVVSQRSVEKHVTSIMAKLGLPSEPEAHRRVLAVLAYLEDESAGTVRAGA